MNDPSGSNWRKWDLHFHTPKSYDHGQKGKTAAEVVDRLVANNIAVVAVTDHHVIDAEFIAEMKAAAGDRLTVLPGVELSSNLGGGDGIHFIGIFPEDLNLTFLSSEIGSKLDIASKRQQGQTDQQLYVEFPAAATIIQNLGGLITIHAHGKHANLETIKNHFSFKMQVKTDLLRDQVDILEVGDAKHTSDYWDKVFPSIGFELPLIIASDDHWKDEYPKLKYCWIKADPTFSGLRMALREPRHRFFLGSIPPSVDRLSKNKTKFISSITFTKQTSMPPGEEWLQGFVPLNAGLVGIIGNKGSGKSALADAVGLVGSCSNSDSFSFLTEKRFCNSKTGRAQFVECTLNWHGGAPAVRLLSDGVAVDDPERVKYLPQSFVESVCNDIDEPGGGAFEQELKKVVFSKVEQAERLGQASLDELINYRTQELRSEADTLATTLIGLAQQRSDLEDRLADSVRTSLEKRIGQVEEQISSHEAGKPLVLPEPVVDPAQNAQTKERTATIESFKEKAVVAGRSIATRQSEITLSQLRAAQADKLLEKLKNLQSEFDRRFSEIDTDAKTLGLNAADLAKLTITLPVVEMVRTTALAARDQARNALDDPKVGLVQAKQDYEDQIKQAQAQLDEPNKQYQANLAQLAQWQAKRNQLEGAADQPGSLEGLKAELVALATVPNQIDEIDNNLLAVAEKIHGLRVKEAEVFRDLYKPVQKFVNDHPLAKEQLKIDFEVELVQEGFVENLISHINQNRLGSFSGYDEGRARATSMAAPIEWETWASVKNFVDAVVQSLHVDQRAGYGGKVAAKSQVGKGKTLGNLYSWLFGLSYLIPRYALKSEGKRIEQLSPGERGTLLLVFYLLVDDSDMPLIIDQPEANLDNTTVAKKLVACIRDARERRQVIIVTHNPNLAVVCDADQIIHAQLDIDAGHRVTYTTGGLEHPSINQFTVDVLEGGRGPLDKRIDTYVVCEKP